MLAAGMPRASGFEYNREFATVGMWIGVGNADR